MKEMFSMDNPLVQFLARVGEMILVNTLFLLCCIPVVTIGAAYTAMHKVTQCIAADEGGGIWRTYWRSFCQNFRQSTAAWLVILVFFVGMFCNLMLVISYFTGNTELILKWILGIIVVMLLAASANLFPLIARYENPLKAHAQNAGILAVVKLPRTLLMVVLNLLPLIIAFFSMETFLSTMVFWLTLGFAFISYVCSILLMPVFREMEAPGGPNMKILN